MAAAVRGERICAALLADLNGETCPVTLHSRFQTAANLSTPLGLVTLLSPGRCLQPYAIGLNQPFDYGLLEPGALALGPEGIMADGRLVVSFRSGAAVDLRLRPGPAPAYSAAMAVRRFLACAPEAGICRMALGRSDGVYAQLLMPRLLCLRRGVLAGDADLAAAAARRMAGCGPGLTPSSDDLLCGYLAMLPGEGAWAGMAAAIAEAAAQGTNDISAALLIRAGAGYFSEDVLELAARLRAGEEGAPLTRTLLRVASFGSSSGRDFLTGVYFGVLDACAIGGMYIDQAGGT